MSTMAPLGMLAVSVTHPTARALIHAYSFPSASNLFCLWRGLIAGNVMDMDDTFRTRPSALYITYITYMVRPKTGLIHLDPSSPLSLWFTISSSVTNPFLIFIYSLILEFSLCHFLPCRLVTYCSLGLGIFHLLYSSWTMQTHVVEC
ncbi:uncharacterized protein F4822DRAFT_206979 [Hypoxylon trugodes]|uniref:uncharacterized protein n=1 Tax=Hypoxylon trugodes TaxID=326681 RepID=UPI002190425D|nr:uncharacterized protein F4822DRAFT_206979 [Hypoxylon trugodes]KAI1389640.1 hypothetical protein F4822DRAFT_206979 [Hypoxylon trugodes]